MYGFRGRPGGPGRPGRPLGAAKSSIGAVPLRLFTVILRSHAAVRTDSNFIFLQILIIF